MTKVSEDIWPLFMECASMPDIVCFGIQEMDISPESFWHNETSRATNWINHILNNLNVAYRNFNNLNGDIETDYGGSGGSSYYRLFESRQMVGILLVLFALVKYEPFISEIQTEVRATGVVGIIGNKGAVGIRFRIYDSTICIINAHFNAHQKNISRRNQDYREISAMSFHLSNGSTFMIFDHDYVFWMGDLNYRIDLPINHVHENIRMENWVHLLKADQLNNGIKSKKIFVDWDEHEIKFGPTYKYIPYSREYDVQKNRIPSWCDRILWRRNEDIKCHTYCRHEFLQSDHRPVSAYFTVNVKSIVDKKLLMQKLQLELDRNEVYAIPDTKVSDTEIDYGEVRFGVPVERTIVLTNIGNVICEWMFIPKTNTANVFKEWLQVEPSSGVLMSGEDVQIKLFCIVQEPYANTFNLKKDRIEDILILHLENGKDYFISIEGEYLISSFDCEIDSLVRMVGPAREGVLVDDAKRFLIVPKELWKLVNWLFRNALSVEELFLECGDIKEMEDIREILDTNGELEEGDSSYSPHSVAETLLRFLESLTIPVIPYSAYDDILYSQTLESAKTLAENLPQFHYNVFFYIVSFLREALKYSSSNKLTIKRISVVFSRVMIRQKGIKKFPEDHLKLVMNFLSIFLMNNNQSALYLPKITASPSSDITRE